MTRRRMTTLGESHTSQCHDKGPNLTCKHSSPTSPCRIGCCSNSGVCGLGPDFCGSDCISSCDYKSECDPGWGAQWSNATDCPLNVCCSKYGFCGTTEDFCGDNTVTEPSCDGDSASHITVGYYEGWSMGRACDGSKSSRKRNTPPDLNAETKALGQWHPRTFPTEHTAT